MKLLSIEDTNLICDLQGIVNTLGFIKHVHVLVQRTTMRRDKHLKQNLYNIFGTNKQKNKRIV